MESPNCAVAVQSTLSQPLSSIAWTGREYNENSLNAALAHRLYTSTPSRDDSLRSVLRDGMAVAPAPRPNIRTLSETLPYPNRSRPLSDILDEAINISNEILLQDSYGDSRVVSPLLLQRQQHPQDIAHQQRRTRKEEQCRRCTGSQPPQ